MTLVHYNARMLAYMGAADAFSTCLAHQVYDGKNVFFQNVLRMDQYHVQFDEGLLRRKGAYTDETEMALAMAQLLTRDAPLIISHREIAREFVATFERGGYRHGYGSLEQVLVDARQKHRHDVVLGFTTELCRTTISRHVMLTPAVVCEVVPNIRDGMRIVDALGKLFRATEVEMAAIKLLALYSHYALHTLFPFKEFSHQYRAHLLEFIPQVYSYLYEKDFPTKRVVGGDEGHGSVANIVYFVSYVLRKDMLSMRLMLDYCLRTTGAVDTAAAIVWGIASARRSDDPIPEFFMRDLEGIDFLLQQGEQLMKKFS